MSTITNKTAEPSLGAYFVRLFKVDAVSSNCCQKRLSQIGAANSLIVHTN